MPSYVTPKRSAAYVFYTALTSQADTKLHQVNPTLAAGDCVISKDGGAFDSLATLPDVFPAAGASVRVQLSATEMTADNVVVRFSDQAGAEWCDQTILIQTTAQQIDDLAAPGDAMTLTADERTNVAATIMATVVEGVHTIGQYLRGFAAVLLGKSSNRGADYRDVDDTKTRVDATLDDEGNRIAITLDLD